MQNIVLILKDEGEIVEITGLNNWHVDHVELKLLYEFEVEIFSYISFFKYWKLNFLKKQFLKFLQSWEIYKVRRECGLVKPYMYNKWWHSLDWRMFDTAFKNLYIYITHVSTRTELQHINKMPLMDLIRLLVQLATLGRFPYINFPLSSSCSMKMIRLSMDWLNSSLNRFVPNLILGACLIFGMVISSLISDRLRSMSSSTMKCFRS